MQANNRNKKDRIQKAYKQTLSTNQFQNPQEQQSYEQKPYFTSRQQDDCSIWPSIDKEIQEIDSTQREQIGECLSAKELLTQNKLKQKALEVSSAMIRLLQEQNQELLSQVSYYQTLIKDRDSQIQQLEQQLKSIKPNESHIGVKELLNQKQSRTSIKQPNKTFTSTQDFFSFAQSRDKNPVIKKSLTKIVNQDHPSFKNVNADLIVSKKLSPYPSRQTVRQQQGAELNKILSNISFLLIQQGIGSSKQLVDEFNELIAIQQQQQEQILIDLQYSQQQLDFQCLPHSPETSKINRRLFTLQNESPSSKASQEGIHQIIYRYQKCIQNFKEYAAYLRAHLCQCLNFLSHQPSPRSVDLSWLSSLVKSTTVEASRISKRRQSELTEQNWQLKRIAEQLIRNIGSAKGHEISKRTL